MAWSCYLHVGSTCTNSWSWLVRFIACSCFYLYSPSLPLNVTRPGGIYTHMDRMHDVLRACRFKSTCTDMYIDLFNATIRVPACLWLAKLCVYGIIEVVIATFLSLFDVLVCSGDDCVLLPLWTKNHQSSPPYKFLTFACSSPGSSYCVHCDCAACGLRGCVVTVSLLLCTVYFDILKISLFTPRWCSNFR